MLKEFLLDHGLQAPDGRPLHDYHLGDTQRAQLATAVRDRIRRNQIDRATAAGFVLWAAERIRAEFPGGAISWQFVFKGLGLQPDQAMATKLVDDGLRWWRRQVRRSDAGFNLYLFTLMAEGGLPEALLADETNYRRAMVGAVAEIESERCFDDGALRSVVAARWARELPQTFRTPDATRLLADLAGAVAGLRTELPADLPLDAADRWLDAHRPGWPRRLPLRMSGDAANGLIRGVLKTERTEGGVAGGPIVRRELRLASGGRWVGWLRAEERAELAGNHFPAARGLRLRLLPVGSEGGSLVYTAMPSDTGWDLRRMGGSGALHLPLDPQTPFALAAFSDGVLQGEIQLAPALSRDDGDYSLWHGAEDADPASPDCLVPLSGAARTRQSRLWLLAAAETPVAIVDATIRLSGPEACTGGSLWMVEGDGRLEVDGEVLRVSTAAESDAPQATLTIGGAVLEGWRSAHDGSLVVSGEPRVLGRREGGRLRSLSPAEFAIRSADGTRLGQHICTWSSNGETLARVRFVALPEGARILLRELGQGAVEATIEGLPPDLHVRLLGGCSEASGHFDGRPLSLALEVLGAPPGLVRLRLWNARTGADLVLVAAWPARAGLILDPDGRRLTQDRPLAQDELRGWRAVSPRPGFLQFNLAGVNQRIALEIAGEVSLAAQAPLIRSLLAQGGPDAQVNVKLIVDGGESRRLEVRRYSDQSLVIGDQARFGTSRNVHALADADDQSGGTNGRLSGCAVNLEDPTQDHRFDVPVSGPVDLAELLPEGPGLWLVQARLDGRTQRALVWSRTPTAVSSRTHRVFGYKAMWRILLDQPADVRWQAIWDLVRKVAEAGDAGMLDQIQALALVPAAAVALMLRVAADEVPAVAALELAAPIFWPTMPVADFVDAVACEIARQDGRYRLAFESDEARRHAVAAVQRRVGEIIRLRPELAGHFALALGENGAPPCCLKAGVLAPLGDPDPLVRLRIAANEAAARSERLPSGLLGLAAARRPACLLFNPYAQPVVDAPLVAAEVALGLRDSLSLVDMLKLTNLRLVDPAYFDRALPLAVQNGASECAHGFRRRLAESRAEPPPASSPADGSSRTR